MHDSLHGEDPDSYSTLCKCLTAISHLVFRAHPPPFSLKRDMADVFGHKAAILCHKRGQWD